MVLIDETFRVTRQDLNTPASGVLSQTSKIFTFWRAISYDFWHPLKTSKSKSSETLMIILFFMHIHLAVIFHPDIFPLAVPHCEICAIFAYFRHIFTHVFKDFWCINPASIMRNKINNFCEVGRVLDFHSEISKLQNTFHLWVQFF